MIHSAIQTATDCLMVDIESTLSKIYQHFHVYTVHVQTLNDFCDFVSVVYKNVLDHIRTRWLCLISAIKRIVDVYAALTSYFLLVEKCPTRFKKIFLK
jgi:hypothetical protein